MNDADRRELDELKQRQQVLERQLTLLASDIRRLTDRSASVETSEVKPATIGPSLVSPLAETPAPKPPPLPPFIRAVPVEELPASPEPKTAPAVSEFVPDFIRKDSSSPTAKDETAAAVPPVFAKASASEEPKGSFEMRLGTYWLVRIGAVMILTGLVFFGNLAYQKMGAAGKVSLLYLAS